MNQIWNLSFDFSALIILTVLLIWFFVEKRIPLRSHNIYLFFIATAFTATCVEIICAEVAEGTGSLSSTGFMWFFSVQIMLTLILIEEFFWYAVALSSIEKKITDVLYVISTVIGTLASIICLVNPVTDIAFYFDGEIFCQNSMGYVLVGVSLLYLISAIVVLYRFVNDMSFVKRAILALNLIFVCCAFVLQISKKLTIVNLAISIGCLTLYQYLNNPGAMTDDTTNVFNRKFMSIFLKNQFSVEKAFDMIVVSMDDFKFINKTYGVSVGDEMLAQVAAYLISVRNSDMVFRFGSDQFCLIVRKNRNDAYSIAEKISERFKHPWYGESAAGIMMSASICCISCPKDAEDYATLMEVIDYSLLVVKKTRKGGISIASELNLDAMREDKAIERAVRVAMDRDELMVYYQPIFSVEHNSYNSAEALVRLKDSKLGWISPEKFIPIAEKNGLIVQMGDIILEKVCKFISENNLKDTSIQYIEVNISPLQLLQDDFVDRVKAILDKYNVSPSQINMEITETATMNGVKIVGDNILSLTDYGIKFSLDDYGSGNANIDYINNMPFSIIKLDKYIIWDSFKSKKAGITLEYTIKMLNALNLHIVAEGVETEEMNDKLSEVGCHYMQGWYYSKAVSDSEFMKLVG